MCIFKGEPFVGIGGVGEGSEGASEGVGDGGFEVFTCEGVFVFDNVVEFSASEDFAAVDAGAGAEVYDEVGFSHGIVVVFDDEEGVSFIFEVFEGLDKFCIIFCVEADGGFVEDVEYAGEVRAELGG